MAGEIALTVVALIIIFSAPCESSQPVPDGLVYTEIQKTLVQGTQGVLTCRFYGKPWAVYWDKGNDPENLSPLLLWHVGAKSGPRYSDGSYDIDDNYSLIIKNVSTADAGRIYCTVSNYIGILIDNYTDVSVANTAITTNPQVTLKMRQVTFGILQCTVHIKARRVSWIKGTSSSANESLVVIENNKGVAKKSGAGYDEGMYDITQEYSLVIPIVKVYHEGLYMCEVTEYDAGITFRDHTLVNVIAEPLKPFPTIQECFNTEQHDPNYCTLVANFEIILTCEVIEYYPDMKVFFVHESKIVEPLNEMELNNTDGTKNKTVTIVASDTKELYTCVASNIPGTPANISSSVILQYGETFQVAVVVISVIAASTLTLFMTCLIWRKRHPQKDFQALEKRINDVVIQHYRGICDLINTECPIQTDIIRNQNMTALFNTSQMLNDCRECRTSKRIKKTIDKENEPAYAWPSNEELETISRQLTQASMKNICDELKIDSRNDEANDEGKRLEMLSKWRTGASNKPIWETWKQLFSVLESIHLGGLLPTLKGPYIYKAELVDFAFNLLMQDLCPVIEQLDINATKLVSYRPVFSPSHLAVGTIKLLIELFASIKSQILQDAREDDLRSIFCSKMENLHYRNVAITGLFEYDMSYGELCSISEAINQNPEGRTDQIEEVRKLSSQNVEASSRMLPGPEIPEELKTVLQLTDQDIADCLHTSNPLTAYELVKMWKKKPRPSVFYYRGTLANELRRNGMPGLADEIIAGKFITVQTSLAFIEDMVQGLNQDQIRSLGELLQLSGDEQHWHTSTPFKEITKQIYDWVAGWTTGIEGSWRNTFLQVTPQTRETAETHRDLNDKLVEHGFLDLAREIMIIEQQLARL